MQTLHRSSLAAAALAAVPVAAQAHVHSAHCGHGVQEWQGGGDPPVIDHGAVPPGGDPSAFRNFGDPFGRWFGNNNAARRTGVRGDGITLTYGVVPDGTAIGGQVGALEDPNQGSDLRAFLNANVGSEATWTRLIDDAYQRWGELSGLTMIREDNDDGAQMGGGGSRGLDGVRADLRIGGRLVDGQDGSNTLAYNYSPSNGDQVIDTSNARFYGNSVNDFRGLRNVLMHEAGHGLGLAHLESSDGAFLMEPFINTRFDGPQLDDLLAIQRNYGDRFEAGTGNDAFNNATALGSLAPVAVTGPAGGLALGTDARDDTTFIGADDTDFVSIDGADDRDVFGFTLTEAGDLTFRVDPRGVAYSEGPQGGAQSPFDTRSLADLAIDLLDASGATLATANATGLGAGEQIFTRLLAGDYFAVVRAGAGSTDNVQLYELGLSATVVPEPTGLLALAGAGGLTLLRRRRAS